MLSKTEKVFRNIQVVFTIVNMPTRDSVSIKSYICPYIIFSVRIFDTLLYLMSNKIGGKKFPTGKNKDKEVLLFS